MWPDQSVIYASAIGTPRWLAMELGGRVSNYNSIYETTSDHRDGPLNTFLASCRTTRLAHKLSKLIHSGTNGDTYSLSPLHLDHLHLFSAVAPRIAKNTLRPQIPSSSATLSTGMGTGNRHGRMFTWFVSHKFIGFIETSIWTPCRTTPDQFKVTRSNCVPREEIWRW